MEKNFVVDTRLDATNYTLVVANIASQYFFSNGEYAPHAGIINAMAEFYGRCVKESKFDDSISHEMTSLADVSVLAADDEFIEEFNKAVEFKIYQLDFANAFRDALDIVNTKKNSLNRAVEMIRCALSEFSDNVAPLMTEQNMANISAIAKDIQKGGTSAEAIVKEYINSGRAEEVLKRVQKTKDAN